MRIIDKRLSQLLLFFNGNFGKNLIYITYELFDKLYIKRVLSVEAKLMAMGSVIYPNFINTTGSLNPDNDDLIFDDILAEEKFGDDFVKFNLKIYRIKF